MTQEKFVAHWRRGLASVLAVMVGLGPLATPTYAALTLLGDQPLSVQNQSKPNIMLTVDDSTSMLYDFLPDGAISNYCRDITGDMNAACGRIDTNTDLTLIGHGKYVTPGYIYEQFGFPFPAYNASFDASGPGAGCDTSILATSTCTGGISPGALPGLERYPGPPGPGKSPLANKPYEYWTLWPAPVHNTELNHSYYNPRLNYEPPAFADGSSYPQMNAANTANWTHVPADPWATTISYVDLTQNVTIGLWCNSDWSQGLESDPRYCRTNGVGPSAPSASASSTDGDYSYPWAPPGVDPSAGSTTALSIAYSKVNSTTHALLAAWTTAKDPKFYYQNDNTIWCDSTSPLWPNYGPLQPQTCSDPPPVITPQTCQGVVDQTCGGGTHETCVGVTPQVCNNAQTQDCNNINNQTCVGAQTQTCSGQQGQACGGGGAQTCDNPASQTCNGAVNPSCANITPQTCNGAVTQSCGAFSSQTCDNVVFPTCDNPAPQSCNNVQTQTCNPVGEVCNLPDPATCPVVWAPPGCPCAGPECTECHLETACPPGVCSITGGQCQNNGECPGVRQCSISNNACNVNTDCPPQPGACSVTGTTCLVAGDCPVEGHCSNNGNPCADPSQCPAVPGHCSIDVATSCMNAGQCPNAGHCTVGGNVCTTNAQCPNTQGTCSVVPTGCFASADCPNLGACTNNGNPCANDTQCPALAGTCSTDGNPCFNDTQCPAEGHCSIVGNLCTGGGQCPTQPGQCTISGATCFNDPQCPPAGGQCTVTHAACVVDANCPPVPGACNLDALACNVDGDCAPSGQCSIVTSVCHNSGECPIVPGTCSVVPTACTVDANCAPVPGHCSVTTGTACTTDATCPGTSSTCSITGEACTGGSYDPVCSIDVFPYPTCSEPAYCPRQGGTCSVTGSPCVHGFFPPFDDFVYCPAASTPGKCSIDHNSCTSDTQCPPIPSGSASAVCSDLVAGSATTTIAVPNGNFEAPFVGDYQYGPPGASWTWGGGSGIQRYYSSFGAYPSNDLWQTAFIQGAGSFSQTINLSAGSYRISFQAARRLYSVPAGTFQPVVVLLDGVPLGSPITPTNDFYFNSFAFGFSIAAAGPHTITFAGTDGTGDKTTFIDQVSITSGMSLLEDANGAGLVCRHNNKAYGVVAADRYNYPDAQFNTPVTAGTGPNTCMPSPRYANVPRHYYKTGVVWCDAQVTTAGDKWLHYGRLTGTSCQDAADPTHTFPRFYQFGADVGDPGNPGCPTCTPPVPPTPPRPPSAEFLDNYANPAFQRIDLDITKRATATYTHTWIDDTGDVQTITRDFDGTTPDVSEMTNYANWFAYYRTRILAVKTVTSLAFKELDAKYRVGFHNLFSLASFVNISDFGAAQKATWFNRLFGVQIPLGQETPSLSAMVRIGEYYKNGTHPQLVGSTDPIVLACQKNFHIFFTDGFTNQSGLPSIVYGNQDDVVPALPEPVLGLTSGAPWPAPYREDPTGSASNALSDYAMYYWVTDLRGAMVGPADLPDNVPTSTKDPASWQHQNFAALSLGTSGKLNANNVPNTQSQIAAGLLQWPKPFPSVYKPDNSGVDDLWHAAVNGRGRFVNAQSADELKLGIGQVLADTANQAGSRAAIGYQSLNLSGAANFVYRVRFEPDWGGGLSKLQIDPLTGLIVGEVWNAATQLDAQLQIIPTVIDTPWFTERKIVTMNGGAAVPFLWGNLSGNQRDSLAPGKPAARSQQVVEYLRGNRGREGDKLNQFRSRGTALGDIVDSGAVYVGVPRLPYREATDSGYTAFKSTFAGRAARVYVGANDGMVHAFDDATGKETWAYVPSQLYRGGSAGGDPKTGLGALTYQEGALPPFKHHFYVDATPRAIDVNTSADTGGQTWRTILVGGLGKGGTSYYALDVTDPTSITNETSAANRVMWEFTDADMGFSYGKPVVTKSHAFNGAWVVILASGYNNPSGIGKLYFVRASDGTLLKTMSTGAGTPGTPSGLAHPSGYTKDFRNQVVEQVYAGDLLGNFWRFDVSDPNPGNWTVGKLGNLVDPGGIPQPVTTPPQIEIDLVNGVDRWVFIGTGKLYDDSDLADTQIQTMYAFKDGTNDVPLPLPATPLDRFTTGLPQVSHNVALDFGLSATPDKGWFDDLPVGQRIVVPVQAEVSIIAYVGTSAQTDPCLTGMAANVYAREYGTGKSLLEDGGGTTVESVAYAEGAVGLDFVTLQTSPGSSPEIRLMINAATTGNLYPPQKTKKVPLIDKHRMSWRLLNQQ